MASPRFFLEEVARCPNSEILKQALIRKGFSLSGIAEESEYRIVSTQEAGGVVLVLRNSGGEELLRRRLNESNCSVLAEVMAEILDAHFLVLSEKEDEISSDAVQGEPTSPTSVQPSLHQVDLPPPQAVKASITPPQTKIPEMIDQGARPTSSSTLFWPFGFIGTGPAVLGPSVKFTLQVTGSVGVQLGRTPWSTELNLSTALPTVDTLFNRRVERWAGQGMLRVGRSLTKRLKLRPWIGIGLNVSRIVSEDALSSSIYSESILLGTGFSMDWPITKLISTRTDVGCFVLTTRDKYVGQVTKDEFGRGPLSSCAISLGFSFGVKH